MPTRYNSENDISVGLDRFYEFRQPHGLLQYNIDARVCEDARALSLAKISDHAPVKIIIEPGARLEQKNQRMHLPLFKIMQTCKTGQRFF